MTESAPASPRVAEELMEIGAKLIQQKCGCSIALAEEIATAIITLAQDAKLREVAEWAEKWAATLELHKADASRQRAQGALVVASHLRAMMVKP